MLDITHLSDIDPERTTVLEVNADQLASGLAHLRTLGHPESPHDALRLIVRELHSWAVARGEGLGWTTGRGLLPEPLDCREFEYAAIRSLQARSGRPIVVMYLEGLVETVAIVAPITQRR